MPHPTPASEPNRRQLLATAAALAATRLFAGVPTIPARAIDGRVTPPPRLGPSTPTHYRFTLGDFEVTTIADAGAMIDGPWPIVGANRPAAEVERLMRDSLLPERRFRPGFTPTVVNTGKELILFDAGNGASGFVPRPAGGWLAAQLGPAGFAADRIDVVVLTHGHPDHIGGLVERGAPLFPNARYVMGTVEHNYWSSPHRAVALGTALEQQTTRLFRANVAPLANRMRFLAPGGEVAPGVRAVEAYGHTPGHLAFHVESRGQRLLLWGDCAHHEVASLARPDWHAAFDMDEERGAATRRRIYAMAAAERLPVVGYHTSFPSVGFVQPAPGGYRWVPLTYQLAP